MAQKPTTSKRNYAAERARRNAAAKRLGFNSADELTRARKAGLFPSAKELRDNPASLAGGIQRVARERAQKIIRQQKAKMGRIRKRIDKGEKVRFTRARGEAASHDRESQAWSDSHSRQDRTKFNKRWDASRRELYYQAFVLGHSLPNDERDFEPTYLYLDLYSDFEYAYDGDPYRHA